MVEKRSALSRWCCRHFRRFRKIEEGNARRSDFYASHRERIAAYQVEEFNRVWRTAVAHVPHFRTLQQARRLPSQFATLEEIAGSVPRDTDARELATLKKIAGMGR